MRMTSLVLGNDPKRGRPVAVDIAVLLRTRLLVQANSGGGKSWLVRRLAEQLFGKVPVILIDPEGEFASLRERYDYALVGPDGDLPADIATAHALAHRLLKLRLSAVCDLFGLPKTARLEWVAAFTRGLIDAPKELWGPCVFVVDEAHTFAPQSAAAPSLEPMKDVASLGRKRGLCSVLCTQRLAKLNKDVAAECHNVLVGYTKHPTDIAKAREQLELEPRDAAAFAAQVRSIRPGQGLFFASGPAFDDSTPLIKIGPVTTTHPDANTSAQSLVVPPAPAAIRALLAQLRDLPSHEVPAASAATPVGAQEIARLRDELAALRARPPEIRVREVRTVPAGLREGLAELARLATSLAASLSTLPSVVTEAAPVKEAFPVQPAPPNHARKPKPNPSPPPVADRPPTAASRAGSAHRLLVPLAQAGDRGLTRVQLATLVGLSHRGGTFANYLSTLNTAGLAAREGDTWKITADGRSRVGPVPSPSAPAELLALWMPRFTSKTAAMLEHLVKTGSIMSRAELANLIELEGGGGTFANYLSSLRSNGLIEQVHGGFRAAAIFRSH